MYPSRIVQRYNMQMHFITLLWLQNYWIKAYEVHVCSIMELSVIQFIKAGLDKSVDIA